MVRPVDFLPKPEGFRWTRLQAEAATPIDAFRAATVEIVSVL